MVPASVLAQDLDADGDVDLVAANLYGGTVSILKNRGTGSFEPPVNVAIWGAARRSPPWTSITTGIVDLAVADEWNDAVALLRNNGTGTFTFIGLSGRGLAPSALTTVQLNDDNGNGRIDAATGRTWRSRTSMPTTVSVLLGRADGSFAPAVNYTTGLGPFSVAAGDLDRDGYQDLVVANVLANTVGVLRNLGTGTFAAAVTYAAGAGPSAVSVGDLDGDADLDVLVTNGTSQDLSVLRNRGNGTFEPAEDFGVGDFPLSLPFSVAAGDLNADNVLDVAVANGQANNVSVLLNTLVAGAHRSRITGSQTASGLDFGVSLNNAPAHARCDSRSAGRPGKRGPAGRASDRHHGRRHRESDAGSDGHEPECGAGARPGDAVCQSEHDRHAHLAARGQINRDRPIIEVTVRDAGPDASAGHARRRHVLTHVRRDG